MPYYRTGHNVEPGLLEGAISLILGIIGIILILVYEIWVRMLLVTPLLTIIGLYFGATALNSIGKYLALLGMVVCLLALGASMYMLWSGGLSIILE